MHEPDQQHETNQAERQRGRQANRPSARPFSMARGKPVGSHRPPGALAVAFAIAGGFTAFLWWLHFMAWGLEISLHDFGIVPRTSSGILGVLFAPLIHGDWEHLVANTPALLVLGTLLIYSYPKSWKPVTVVIWLCAGLGTWWFGRDSVHFGASGLTHGLMFYLFVMGIIRRDRPAMAVSMAVFFLYGGMVMTIVPREPGISWESHLFGAVGGLLSAALFFRRDPRPPEPSYSWDEESPEKPDPVIGDLWKYTPEELEQMRRDEVARRIREESEEFPLAGDEDDEERW